MYKFSVSIARFLVMLIVLQSFSFAEDFTIPAKQNGPLASLKAAGKSIDLLASLEDENGQKLRPEDNGKWRDKNFFLPEAARPDREARLLFIAKIYNSGKSRKHRPVQEARAPRCPVQSPIPQPTPPTKEHPFVQTSEDVTVEAGKAVVLAGFADENGKVYQLEADQSAAGVAKFSSAQRITIHGLKPGTVTFTVWPTVDKNIRKLIIVKVVEPPPASATKVKTAPEGDSNWLWYLLGICILGLLAFMVYLVRAMAFSRQGAGQTQFSGSDDSDDDQSPTKVVDDDEFERETL